MFTLFCSALAALLAVSAFKQYRLTALVLALEFALHVLAYKYLFLDFRAENKWFIYLLYSAIQLPVMLILKQLKAHFIIVSLIFANMCYNMLTMAGYFNENFTMFYYAKDQVVGAIMIFELIYLGILNKYVVYHRGKQGYTGLIDIDVIFRVWNRHPLRGIS